MENLEISGKTVEEAIKKALAQLNAGLDEVEVTVLNEGKSGILGLGSEEARISVRLKQVENPGDNPGDIAREVLERLLKFLDIGGTVQAGSLPPGLVSKQTSKTIVFNILGDDMGILIGRRGQTLDALQYLVRLIVSKRTNSRIPIIIDAENYKQRRFEDLKTLALNVAAQVKAKKTSVRLEPMSPFERRIIHLTLAEDPDVVTESIGEGESRKVVIMPKIRKQ